MCHVIATADLHGRLPSIQACDLLLLAGDICPSGSLQQQRGWLDTSFRKWLEEIPAQEVVTVAGNCDYLFEKAPELVPKNLRMHYLENTVLPVRGLVLFGCPWQLPFHGVFNKKEKELEALYAKIPQEVDIVISHGPPFGILDQVKYFSEELGEEVLLHTGSLALRKRLLQLHPQLMVFGHIHGAQGQVDLEGRLCANVALIDEDGDITQKPQSFYLRAREAGF
ncbi:MAG: hypothetical protein FJZ63_05855 [Chlamydiae bacterium]|nr:hypothetical protein [Chlamydiota bacterium]